MRKNGQENDCWSARNQVVGWEFSHQFVQEDIMKILQMLPSHSEVDISFMEMHENLPPYFERSVPVVLFNILDFSILNHSSSFDELQNNLAQAAESFIIFVPNVSLKLAQKVCAITIEAMLVPSVEFYHSKVVCNSPDHPDYNLSLNDLVEKTRTRLVNQILALNTVDDCSDFMIEYQITLKGVIKAYQTNEKEGYRIDAFANFLAKYGTSADWVLEIFKDFHIGNQFNH